MPTLEKAILDPFSPLTVPEALMVAVCGMVVVFMMLAILALVIIVISKAVGSIEGKAAPAPAPKKAASAPASKPVTVPAAPAAGEEELVAVIMAAVAEESGMSPGTFSIPYLVSPGPVGGSVQSVTAPTNHRSVTVG